MSPGPSTSKAGAGGGSAHDGRASPPDTGGKSIMSGRTGGSSGEPKAGKVFYYRVSPASTNNLD